jgi:hypothetical protein
MAATTALPTLSQVQTLDTAYLREAAGYWTRTAELWEQAFTEVHGRMSTPGGAPWKGEAAGAAQERSFSDLVQVRGASNQLHRAAAIALRGDQQLQACKEGVLEAVHDARAEGFGVGEDYSVTDRSHGGTSEFRAARLAAAQGHAGFIRHRVAALVISDQQLTTQITAATRDIDALTFEEHGIDDHVVRDKHNRVQAVDHHTFKDAPNPEPDPPPGGWSSDPLMRAAQKIAYGHASGPGGHMADFPGMTKDELADLIYGKMKRSIENPTGLQLGASKSDGAPLIYDPKDNVLIVRDPRGADCGTVFKPDLQEKPDYVRKKFGWYEPSFKPGQLADEPIPAPTEPRPGPPAAGEPVPAKPPVSAPVEAPPVKPLPRIGEGGGPMPRLPFGGGLPWDAPATGPHVIHPHKPGGHHRMPLLGELPDDYED